RPAGRRSRHCAPRSLGTQRHEGLRWRTPAVILCRSGLKKSCGIDAIMNFHSDLLPAADRAAGYEGALRQYFSGFDTAIDVHVESPGPESFAARLEPLAIGHLGGAINCSNSPHRLHAEVPVDAPLGIDFYLLRAGTITFTDPRGTVELASGDMVLLRSDVE